MSRDASNVAWLSEHGIKEGDWMRRRYLAVKESGDYADVIGACTAISHDVARHLRDCEDAGLTERQRAAALRKLITANDAWSARINRAFDDLIARRSALYWRAAA